LGLPLVHAELEPGSWTASSCVCDMFRGGLIQAAHL